MQLRYVFSELGQGLRRNLSMHIAVVLTLFVSLTLVGLGVLLNQQAERSANQWGTQLEITVWLCKADDDNPLCVGEATEAQKAAIVKVIEDNPEVADYRFESSEVAFEKVKDLYGFEKFDGPNPPITADALPQSYWIELKDPQQFQGIKSAVVGLDGVANLTDLRDVVGPIYDTIDAMKKGAYATAIFLIIAALLMVGNTIRLAAFARRKEIGIMRLVGASTLYIALPFLMEALVTALLGVALASAALAGFVFYGIQRNVGERLQFIYWIGAPEYVNAVIFIAILGPLLTLIPTLLLTRKYLKV